MILLTIQIILLLGFTYLAGYLYHKGGDTQRQLWRCTCLPIIQLAVMALFCPKYLFIGKFWLVGAISAALFAGSLSTYWKKKGADALWWNWLLTGFGYALAILPYMLVIGHWKAFFIRLAVLPLATMVWSVLVSRVSPEEGGRGGMAIGSLGLFLI